MTLNRDSIKNGLVQDIVAEAERLGLVSLMSEAERRESRRQTLAAKPDDGGDVWVFGYGSLMWNPAFDHVETRQARLFGYHRAFCLWTHVGRGSPDCPGLVLGLDRGGSVAGMALRIDADKVEEELDIVWSREMVTAAYCPRWMRLATPQGQIHAIAFLINHAHPRYAGKLCEDEAARAIALAEGRLGRCRDYLESTVTALQKLGIADGRMENLLHRVDTLRNGAGQTIVEEQRI